MSKKRRKPPPRRRPRSAAPGNVASDRAPLAADDPAPEIVDGDAPAVGAAPQARWSDANRGWMLGLAAITLLAGLLRLISLARVPDNPFYDAAVRSMARSWHNFLYGAFDPSASAAIDKPPFDLWVQVITVKLIGFSSTALKLPSALAATAAVPLLYDVVRRLAGRTAGLSTAAILAVLPVAVVTARSDTMDSMMMALLVVVSWLLLRYAERRQLRWLLLAALVLGVDFNVKLFEALIPVPAFLVFLWMSSHDDGVGLRLRRFAAAGVLAAVVALSWLVPVSLTPRHDRPYPIGSTDGSVWNAVFVYNGTARFTKAPRPATFDVPAAVGVRAAAAGATAPGRGATAGPVGAGATAGGGGSGATAGGGGSGATAGGGGSGATAGVGKAGSAGTAKPKARVKKPPHRKARTASAPAGPLRLFRRSLVDFGGLIGTVLFAGLVLGLLALLGSSTRLMRPRPDASREERTRRAAVFALGIWLFTGIILFSFSGRVHPRYLEAFTPAVAATVGVSLSILAGRVRDRSSLYLLAGGLAAALLETLVAVGPGSLVRAGVAFGLLIGLIGCGLAYLEIRGRSGSAAGPGDGPDAGRRWSRPAVIVAFALVAVLSFPIARDVGSDPRSHRRPGGDARVLRPPREGPLRLPARPPGDRPLRVRGDRPEHRGAPDHQGRPAGPPAHDGRRPAARLARRVAGRDRRPQGLIRRDVRSLPAAAVPHPPGLLGRGDLGSCERARRDGRDRLSTGQGGDSLPGRVGGSSPGGGGGGGGGRPRNGVGGRGRPFFDKSLIDSINDFGMSTRTSRPNCRPTFDPPGDRVTVQRR